MISWVIGRGGLLGQAVERGLRTYGPTWHPDHRFSWGDPMLVERELTTACSAFASRVGRSPWQIAWCAGAGTVGSVATDLDEESRTFSNALQAIRASLCGTGRGPGALFLASSAGAVYAGVGTPPFNEESPVAPLAPYGWSKLRQEAEALQWSEETATPLLIGRLANLYGPGQNRRKSQGLITQVCMKVLTRQPLTLYVPLDTIRDYLFSEDAGKLVADGMNRLRSEHSRFNSVPTVVKILSSQRPVTIASVLAQVRWITKRPASVIIATSPNAVRQARDLRMASSVWTDLDRRPMATLGEGIRCVLTDILGSSLAGPNAVAS